VDLLSLLFFFEIETLVSKANFKPCLTSRAKTKIHSDSINFDSKSKKNKYDRIIELAGKAARFIGSRGCHSEGSHFARPPPPLQVKGSIERELEVEGGRTRYTQHAGVVPFHANAARKRCVRPVHVHVQHNKRNSIIVRSISLTKTVISLTPFSGYAHHCQPTIAWGPGNGRRLTN
jgi:hypothetical protein